MFVERRLTSAAPNSARNRARSPASSGVARTSTSATAWPAASSAFTAAPQVFAGLQAVDRHAARFFSHPPRTSTTPARKPARLGPLTRSPLFFGRSAPSFCM